MSFVLMPITMATYIMLLRYALAIADRQQRNIPDQIFVMHLHRALAADQTVLQQLKVGLLVLHLDACLATAQYSLIQWAATIQSAEIPVEAQLFE